LRVIIQSTDRTVSAYLTFSSQIGPPMLQFRLYGPENSLVLDHNQRILIQLRKTDTRKSYLNHFIAPRIHARKYLANASRNIHRFLRKDFHMDYGRRQLVRRFYDAVRGEGPVPIPYREIILTARIMDAIFEQITGTYTSRTPIHLRSQEEERGVGTHFSCPAP
jgi:predicted dehydrogenase